MPSFHGERSRWSPTYLQPDWWNVGEFVSKDFCHIISMVVPLEINTNVLQCLPVSLAISVTFLYTVRCRYNAVNFFQIPHNRHPIAWPWEWDMLCVLWLWTLLFNAVWHITLFWTPFITAPDCVWNFQTHFSDWYLAQFITKLHSGKCNVSDPIDGKSTLDLVMAWCH